MLPPGTVGPDARDPNDPRWRRPLPWTPAGSYHVFPLQWMFAAGASVVVLVIPIAIVRLARRRRAWGLPMLMALPIALAIPLAAFVAARAYLSAESPSIPPWVALLGIALAAVAGLPVLVYGYEIAMDVHRRHWRRAAIVLGVTIAMSAVVGAYMLRVDRNVMPAIEFFDWSEWYSVLPVGGYVVGLLLLFSNLIGRIREGLRRISGQRPATA
jgi:hypothetical protein